MTSWDTPLLLPIRTPILLLLLRNRTRLASSDWSRCSLSWSLWSLVTPTAMELAEEVWRPPAASSWIVPPPAPTWGLDRRRHDRRRTRREAGSCRSASLRCRRRWRRRRCPGKQRCLSKFCSSCTETRNKLITKKSYDDLKQNRGRC